MTDVCGGAGFIKGAVDGMVVVDGMVGVEEKVWMRETWSFKEFNDIFLLKIYNLVLNLSFTYLLVQNP